MNVLTLWWFTEIYIYNFYTSLNIHLSIGKCIKMLFWLSLCCYLQIFRIRFFYLLFWNNLIFIESYRLLQGHTEFPYTILLGSLTFIYIYNYDIITRTIKSIFVQSYYLNYLSYSHFSSFSTNVLFC